MDAKFADAGYPYNHAALVRRDGDLAVLSTDMGHLCGYCAFPDEDLPETWRGDYDAPGLQFLAIHGGLTYAHSENGLSVFGFDCAHAGDASRPELKDPDHVLNLAKQMREQISALAARRKEWLTADREEKAKIIDEIRAAARIKTEFGLGGMIEMLAGAPSLGEA